jgi:hypothetical protein
MVPSPAFDFSGDVAIVTGAGSRMNGKNSLESSRLTS